MTDTLFSIIITFYNQRELIKDAVDSALSLRNANKEIIVVDDGSTDGSQDILRRYGDAIRLVCLESNQGAGAARNCGGALATGEYFVFLDGDDALLPWALDVYERIVQAKKPKLIIGSMRWFEGTLPVIQPRDTPHEIRLFEFKDYLRRDRPYSKSTIKVIDRQSFQTVQGWSTEIWPMNDNDFILRLCASGQTILILTPPTSFRRSHANNTFKCVPPYIPSLWKIIQNDRLGKYPGGNRRRFERHAVIGGLVFGTARMAVEAGLYWDALKLLARGWPLVLAAATHRLGVILRGRRPGETIEM